MTYEKVIASYDKSEKAKDAMRALQASGFSSSDISVLSRDSLTQAEIHETGLWRRLFGREISEQEGAAYGRTIEAGGGLLSLRVPETEVARAIEILNVQNPAAKAAAVGAVAASVVNGKDEQVFRLAEEQIDVTKRQVQKGMARIRRFITQKPVEAKVTLHEEHIAMVRRSITNPNFIKDKEIDWTDTSFVLTETDEEPVITKTAHFVEEVIVRKEGSDHVETVRDTVRRQNIDIEHDDKTGKKTA
jgi:uncharacterized protein (TIGR02271 family)